MQINDLNRLVRDRPITIDYHYTTDSDNYRFMNVD